MSSTNKSWLVPAVKSAVAFFSILPLSVCLCIARGIGYAGFWLMPRKRAVVYANLRTAFAGQMTPQAINALTCRVFVNFAQASMELLCLPKITKFGFERYVEVRGQENVDAALKKGKGVIFLATHDGNWELGSIMNSLRKHPYSMVANQQAKTPELDDLLKGYRRVAGAKVIPPGLAIRGVIKALKDNEIVSLVLDQGGREGEAVEFFGKTASMSSGAIRIALKYGVSVCPAWIERVNGKHVLQVFPALNLQDTGDIKNDVLFNVQQAATHFEALLKERPDEYMWFYKIYKYTTQPHVVILDDGRTGHLRQSQAVSRALTGLLKQRNKYPKESTVLIAFRSDSLAKCFSLYTLLAQYLPFLRGEGCLKYFLTEKSYQDLLAVKADYVISAGSKTAGVNFILKSNHLAKSVNILTPGLLSFKNFELNIVPEHDLLGQAANNVLKTKVALSMVNPAYLKTNSDALSNHFSHLKGNVRLKFGLLIGGNTKGVDFNEAKMRSLINHVKEAALHYNADILVTTSRRTPEAIEQMVAKELKNFERCPLCVIANQNNLPQVVGGILGLCDLIFVSGESISMVSEAVTSGKKTIVYDPRGSFADTPRDKYEAFVLRLHDEGYVIASSVKDLHRKITQVLTHKVYLKTLDDEGALVKALGGII